MFPHNKPSSKEESTDKNDTTKKTLLPEQLVYTIDCKQGAVRAVRYNFDGNYCLTCGNDKTIKLWNPKKQMLIKKYTGHGYDVLDVAGSNDNSQLASCGSDKTVIYWDVGSGQIIRRFRGHAGRINCVEFNEESTVILSGSVDSSVRAWDCRSRKSSPIQILDEAKDSISSLQVTDHEILTSSIDGKVRRYDLRVGTMFSDFIGSAVTSAKFSKDGQCILSSAHDNTLRLLDVTTGEMLGEYTGHKNSKYMIECGLNYKDDHVLSGSEDGLIYIWDLVEGTITKRVAVRPNKVIHSLTLHPEENLMIAACEDKIYFFTDENYEPPDDIG
ncbi:WD repeat domain-containing protein 83-like [Clavelina lepadiformis]|uniref:WD repeat domain-containing protein 83-like n=1 Tax=Clavelina lepadiformis TaxID=159417 RepID=UPI00404117CD